MRNASKIFATLLVIVSMSSCATMFGGSKYRAHVKVPNYPDAQITVDGRKTGAGGEATKLVKRNKSLTVEVEQEGCKDFQRTYDNKVRVGSEVLSFVSWGLVGLILDFATGAAYKPDVDDSDVEKVGIKDFNYVIDYDEYCPQNTGATK
jgi:hypothetical protein